MNALRRRIFGSAVLGAITAIVMVMLVLGLVSLRGEHENATAAMVGVWVLLYGSWTAGPLALIASAILSWHLTRHVERSTRRTWLEGLAFGSASGLALGLLFFSYRPTETPLLDHAMPFSGVVAGAAMGIVVAACVVGDFRAAQRRRSIQSQRAAV